MAHRSGLDRRAFLQNAGMTALLGAVGATAPGSALGAGLAAAPPTNGKYDFDTVYNRIGTDCVKWDAAIKTYGKDSIAVGMGIADMDFRLAPAISRALSERMQHENWGYLTMPASFNESIVNWNKRRYGVEIRPSEILHSAGVHSGLIAALTAFSPPGSKVIVQSPTYNAFYSLDIATTKNKPSENRLKLVNGRYSMDFDDLERRIDHDTHTLILCNPQNPTGNTWSRDDLMTLGEICLKRRVIVLADEIHCDFVTKGNRYTPFASLPNEAVVRNSITFKAASKSFGLAAMKCAYLHSTNPDYLERLKDAGRLRQDINTLGMIATQAAYNEGEDWLDQCVAYIDGTLDLVESFVARNMPMVKVVKPQGTYLAWLDMTDVAERIGTKAMADAANRENPSAPPVTPETMLERYLVKHARVQLNQGGGYGTGGQHHMRMNIAASRKLVELALTNMANALKNPQVSMA
jgi:cystathionine beta-lyase